MNCYEPGQVTPFHVHPRDDEMIFCVEGRGTITFADRSPMPIEQGSLIILPKGLPHGIAAAAELKALQAAIGWWNSEYGPLTALPAVTLPPKNPPKTDYLTRYEIAARLRAARRQPQSRHLCRFLLLGWYTGSRPGALLGLRWLPSPHDGWIDLDRGVIYREGSEALRSNKKATPVRIHRRLLCFLRRWRDHDLERGVTMVVHYGGARITKVRHSWESVRKAAGHTRRDTPHCLRHSCATWLMQAGVPIWEASGYLAMSPQTLEAIYGHHSPLFQGNAAGFHARNMPGKLAKGTGTQGN
jgi:integrase